MAASMITAAKVGAMIGRKRAFAIGCVIYGCGSSTTALAPSLEVLLFGWSLLEGIGAALILPAIVALVAGNFAVERRPAAYSLVAAAGAIAIAVGPLIGGFFTTYFSWRWVSPAKSYSCSSSCFWRAGSQTLRPRSVHSSTWSAPCSRRSGSGCSSSVSSARGSGAGFSPRRAAPPGQGCRRRCG